MKIILALVASFATAASAQPAPLPVTNADCWDVYEADFVREYNRYLAELIDIDELLVILNNLQRRLDECIALDDEQVPCSGCDLTATCDECFAARAACAWREYIDGVLSGDELDGEMENLRHLLVLCKNLDAVLPPAIFHD